MPSASSEARLHLAQPQAVDDRGSFVSAIPTLDATPNGHRIRARRLFDAPPCTLFDAWTTRAAWQSWMRLRARSRVSIVPCVGSAFRLEIAEGATIHVITGQVDGIRVPELLSLSWAHQERPGRSSTVDVCFLESGGVTELVLNHHHIESRREASWLMRLWSTVLDRLDSYVAGSVEPSAGDPRLRESPPSFIIVR